MHYNEIVNCVDLQKDDIAFVSRVIKAGNPLARFVKEMNDFGEKFRHFFECRESPTIGRVFIRQPLWEENPEFCVWLDLPIPIRLKTEKGEFYRNGGWWKETDDYKEATGIYFEFQLNRGNDRMMFLGGKQTHSDTLDSLGANYSWTMNSIFNRSIHLVPTRLSGWILEVIYEKLFREPPEREPNEAPQFAIR